MSDLDEAVKRLETLVEDSFGGALHAEEIRDIRTVLVALAELQPVRWTADAMEKVTSERDEALAVISELNAALARFPAAVAFRAEATEILGRAPVDVLRERDAEKWNEGHSQALANIAWPHERKGNPYRKEQTDGTN